MTAPADSSGADHDPEQDLQEYALIAHPRIADAHETRELRIILIQRPLDLPQLALLVFWKRHDAPPKRKPCTEHVFGNHHMYPFIF